jgi:hypothetical protein
MHENLRREATILNLILAPRRATPWILLALLAACGGNQSAVVSTSPSGANTAPNSTGAAPTNHWSTMGVVADGKTDNTSALNALPANVDIVGDCPAGGTIVANSPWIWHSNLTITIQPNCKIVSFVTGSGAGSYAITQADLNTPITNVSVSGLQISSFHSAQADRIMQLWVDNFTLLHWTVTASGGVMFIRGSNQEIAYGTVTGTNPTVGNPGIRHIGNLPTVPTQAGRPANVYIHDNNIESGDAVYQACQPLSTDRWTNVSSDGILYQNNVGHSTQSALILVGEDEGNLGAFTDWTCSNIVYDNVSGSGTNRGVRIVSGGPLNVVSNITLENSTIDASTNSRPFGAIEVNAVGGAISGVDFENVSIRNVNRVALTTLGNISGFKFADGAIDPPSVSGQANVVISDTTGTSITNSTIGSNLGDVIQVGPNDDTGAQHPANSITVSGNTFHGVANGFAGVRMFNTTQGNIAQNTIASDAGATSSTGIYFSMKGPDGPGTTDSTATGNDLVAIAGVPIVFAPNQGNSAVGNNL